jgi:hypothetical protein
METLDFPHHIDEPPTLLLWRMDDLMPPVLEGEVTIAREYASQAVEESWGVYVAQLLGNVGPTTVDGLTRVLDPLLAGGLHREVMKSVADQTEAIKREHCNALRPANGRLRHRHPHRLRHRTAQDPRPGGRSRAEPAPTSSGSSSATTAR